MAIKNIVIGIAIIILTISVVVYGVNLLFDRPEYSDFCERFKTAQVIETQEQCEAIGGQWNADIIPRPVVEGERTIEGYCNRDFTCNQEYDDARESYARNAFLVALPLGIIIILLGALVFHLDAVGAGLMGGGVGTILFGVGGYWRFTGNALRFLFSLAGLVIVIWATYKYNKKFDKKHKK